MLEYPLACVRSFGRHGQTKTAYQACRRVGHHDTTVIFLYVIGNDTISSTMTISLHTSVTDCACALGYSSIYTIIWRSQTAGRNS